jgi:hypothetical protein
MNFLIAIVAGVVGAVVSAVLTFFVTVGICQALQVSDRDGGIGYFGMFLGLIAGIAGMVLSIILTLRLRHETFAGILAQTPMALAGIVALVAVGMVAYYNSQDHPVVDGAPPLLDFELQAPPGTNLPDPKSVQVRLQAGKSGADGWWEEKQTEQVNGRPVLSGHMQLYLRTSDRLLVFQFPGQVDHLFKLRLPASPLGRKYQKWSDWQPADFVFTPDSRIGKEVPPESSYNIRYLVEGLER